MPELKPVLSAKVTNQAVLDRYQDGDNVEVFVYEGLAGGFVFQVIGEGSHLVGAPLQADQDGTLEYATAEEALAAGMDLPCLDSGEGDGPGNSAGEYELEADLVDSLT